MKSIKMKKNTCLFFVIFLYLIPYIGAQVDVEISSFTYKDNANKERTGEIGYTFWQDAGTVMDQIPYKGKAHTHQLTFSPSKNKFTIGLMHLKLDRKTRGDFKLAVKNNCIIRNGVLNYRGSFIEIEEGDTREKLSFNVSGNGTGKVAVRFAIVPKNSSNINDWVCTIGEIVFKLNATGFPEVTNPTLTVNPSPKPPDNKPPLPKTLKELCTGYTRYRTVNSTEAQRFKEEYRKIEAAIWRKANSIKAWEKYITDLGACTYIKGRYITKAKDKIAEEKRKAEKLGITEKWESLKAEKNKEAILTFFAKKNLRKKQYTLKILDTLFVPKYKNISLNNGITIDDSRWLSSQELKVELKKEGNYKILVADTIGRSSIFDFGYVFQANSTNESDAYTINIEGGDAPFFVSLWDEKETETLLGEFEQREIKLVKEDLIKKGIVGTFNVSLKHSSDQRDQVFLDKELAVEKPSSTQLISAIVGFLCAALLSVSVFLFLRKKLAKGVNKEVATS